MSRVKTIIPNDLRDFLSILSFIGFVAIFFKFTLQNSFLSNIMDSIFLVIAGGGLLAIAKVFSIHRWASDGIQKSEALQITALVFGLSSMIIGILLLFGIPLPVQIQGMIGVLALVPALFIFFDYLAKNKSKW